MPVDKFGRTQIGETPSSSSERVSLSYISRNFQRKGDIIDMTGSPIVNLGAPRNRQDAATKNYVLETIERLLGEHIQISGTGETVTKSYVDDQVRVMTQRVLDQLAQVVRNRKPVITVVAEESGPMQNNQYEWSFGNGSSGPGHANCGYIMLGGGRLLRMGLASSDTSSRAQVNIVINGIENTSYSVEKMIGSYSGTVTFTTPLELSEGDRVNLRSVTSNSNPCAVVSLLIELDV